MKIYAVFTGGSYFERELVAVFSSLEAAEEYQRYIDCNNEPEEFELDSEKPPDWWDAKKKAFRCSAAICRLDTGFSFGPIECEKTSGVSTGYHCLVVSDPDPFKGLIEYSPNQLKDSNVTFNSRRTWWIVVNVISSDKDEAIHRASEFFSKWIYDNTDIFLRDDSSPKAT